MKAGDFIFTYEHLSKHDTGDMAQSQFLRSKEELGPPIRDQASKSDKQPLILIKVQKAVMKVSVCPELSRCSCHTCGVFKTGCVQEPDVRHESNDSTCWFFSLAHRCLSYTPRHTFCLFHPDLSQSAHKYSYHLLHSVLMQIHHLLHLYLCLCKLEKRQSNSFW